jgi:hypothetical protein
VILTLFKSLGVSIPATSGLRRDDDIQSMAASVEDISPDSSERKLDDGSESSTDEPLYFLVSAFSTDSHGGRVKTGAPQPQPSPATAGEGDDQR